MTKVRFVRHEAVAQCGSYEVRFFDGRPSRFFYWDDLPGHTRPEQLTSEQALEAAHKLARDAQLSAPRRCPPQAQLRLT